MMRVLEKEVQMNENHQPVLIVMIELPLVVSPSVCMGNSDFLAEFYDALERYDDEQMQDKD